MKLALLFSLLFLSAFHAPATAATHTIMFGPGYYSPALLKVDVGDVIVWQADDSSTFAGHPLESFDFPAGAEPILVTSGTTYSYPVTVAGTYRYRCQFHWVNGMLGEFSTEEDPNTTKHVITFANFAYSPNLITTVTVGDTIEWQGDFTMHPLQSLSVPAGAATFSNSTGTVFQYVVTMEGNYGYWCAIHGATNNMAGAFIVQSASVDPARTVVTGSQAFPNPTGSLIRIPLEMESGAEVTVAFYDVTGREVSRTAKQVASGSQEIDADLSGFPSGTYTWQIVLGQKVMTGQVIVAR